MVPFENQTALEDRGLSFLLWFFVCVCLFVFNTGDCVSNVAGRAAFFCCCCFGISFFGWVKGSRDSTSQSILPLSTPTALVIKKQKGEGTARKHCCLLSQFLESSETKNEPEGSSKA